MRDDIEECEVRGEMGKYKAIKRKREDFLSPEEVKRLEKEVLRGAAEGSGWPEAKGDRGAEGEKAVSRCPAWNDPDDDEPLSVREAGEVQGWKPSGRGLDPEENFRQVLEAKLRSVMGSTPSWALLPEPTSEDPLLRWCGRGVEKGNGDGLPKTTLNLKLLPSLNSSTRNEGRVIKSVEFHPTNTLALVAGLSGTASVFNVDGKGNKKMVSVHFERFPIRCAKFTGDGRHFLVGSQNHSHFYSYDMAEGRSVKIPLHHNLEQTNMKKFEVSPNGKLIAVVGRMGAIHLLSAISKEWIATLRMNSNALSIAFSPDGAVLYSHGDGGEVYVWDVNSRSCKGRFYDAGCLAGMCIAATNNFIATGCSSGVVNIYNSGDVVKTNYPAALKVVKNLVTPVSSVRFDPTGQMLAIASDEKDNAAKLIHLGSMSVFNNFPLQNTEFHRVQTMAFSPSSGYLSVANNQSTAFLFRLKHFEKY